MQQQSSSNGVHLKLLRIAIVLAIAVVAALLSPVSSRAKPLTFFVALVVIYGLMFGMEFVGVAARNSKYAQSQGARPDDLHFLAYLQSVTIAVAVEVAWFSPVAIWAKILIFVATIIAIYSIMLVVGIVLEAVQRAKAIRP